MESISCNVDIRKIVSPKWFYVFLPWKWNHFFIYKKRKLKPVFTMEDSKMQQEKANYVR